MTGFANDPVQFGLVATLNRPGGNLTGFNAFAGELGAKALALLHELMPSIATIGFLENPNLAGKRLEMLREVTPGLRRLAIMLNVGAPASVRR